MMREFYAAADKYLLFALTACAVYAVMQTIEVWSLRRKMRHMRSIYCEKCKCQIQAVCQNCYAKKPPNPTTPYRDAHRDDQKPPPLQKPGPGRSRLG